MAMRTLLAAIALAASTLVNAQQASVESVRLADVLIEASWPTMNQMMPVVIAGLAAQIRAGGKATPASEVFIEELHKAFLDRDTVARGLAVALSQQYSTQELLEITAFMQSPTGRKYLQFSTDPRATTAFIAPVLKQACERARPRLGDAGRAELNPVCK
jgi:hypothetical protein